MGIATERWSVNNGLSVQANRVVGRREWDVIAADDERDAISSATVARIGEAHPRYPNMSARTISTTRKLGPQIYIVSAQYDTDTGGGGGRDQPDDPRNFAVRFQWSTNLIEEQVEEDIKGNPITNSAGIAFEEAVMETVVQLQLRISRWEPGYSPIWAMQFMNTINEVEFNIATGLHSTRIPAGTAKLLRMQPTSAYAADAKLIEIEYMFEFRKDGWRKRVMDVGVHKIVSNRASDTEENTAPELILGTDKMPLGTPVRLNGMGMVFNPDLNPEGYVGPGPPAGSTVDDESEHTVFLCWDTLKSSRFSDLGF